MVLAGIVVLVDTVLLAAAHGWGLPPWLVAGYALLAALVTLLGRRRLVAAFAVTAAIAAATGLSFVLLLFAAYRAGRAMSTRSRVAVVVGAAVGGAGVRIALGHVPFDALPNLAATYLVFVALPLLVGRYLAQHERLVTTLDQHNRRLLGERELRAEQERLRERLRIAREMHDSLGHRLSLVTVQAAALEVGDLPEPHGEAVHRLAAATRAAVDELHELVGALRCDQVEEGPGVAAVGALVSEFHTAGVRARLQVAGPARTLAPAVDRSAYRVVAEGLTNAAKHAPDQPVTVRLDWESDTLLITVTNPVPPVPVPADGRGRGLAGLAERLTPLGGLLDHRRDGAAFRLVAMLPIGPAAATEEPSAPIGTFRTAAIGVAVAALMFVLLPAGLLLGAG